jgi:hypothetical protein
MIVNVKQMIGESLVISPKKMILHSLYEELQKKLEDNTQTVAFLQQKVVFFL